MNAASTDTAHERSKPHGLSVWSLARKELRHRWWNGLLAVLAVTVTVGLFVLYYTTAQAADRETKRVVRDLGFNLRIIPRGTDMNRFWAEGFSDRTMPEDAVRRLAESEQVFLSYNHLVASLQGWFLLGEKPVILTGVAPAITAPAQRDRPMGFSIPEGQVYLGYEVARRLNVGEGDSLSLGTETFAVERILAESGTDDDIRVYALLSDAQRLLELPARINEIKAIDCLCQTADEDPLGALRDYLAKVLPEAKVIQMRTMADTRARQRRLAAEYYSLLTAVMLVVGTAWIGLLAVVNVRERRPEIGVLRALGFGSSRIASLFMLKAILIGLMGAALGFVVGSVVAVWVGPQIFTITARSVRPELDLLVGALLWAPCLAALASLGPTVWAVTQDPATALREE